MNNCPNCGSNVNPGEVFCRSCGTKLPIPQNNVYNNLQQPQQVNNDSTEFLQPQPMNNGQVNNQPIYSQQQNVNPALQGFQQSPNYGHVNNGMTQNAPIDNGDLIDAYIGKNADKLKNGSFSGGVFFFGFLYVLYRKMWLLGFVWFAGALIADMFLPDIANGVFLISNIIICLQFKKWYLKYVVEQVDTIKAANPGNTQEQLMMICSQKGGTTLVPVIIVIVIFFILSFLVGSLLV